MSRRDIYYWKCDRPAAFHGTGPRPRGDEVSEEAIRTSLVDHFHPDTLTISPAAGQGNHLTWNAEIDGVPAFLRIENGPEGDDHLEMESAVLGEVAKVGVHEATCQQRQVIAIAMQTVWAQEALVEHAWHDP